MNYNNYSVLMSVYKKENPKFLEKAIESMLSQTVKPDEIVIVKDGILTPDLDNVLDKYKLEYNQLFNIVGYDENKGLGFALNFGLEYCKNELIARMDTDDIARVDRCKEQISLFIKNPNLDIVGGDIAEFIDLPNNSVSYRKAPVNDFDIKEYAKKRCPLNHVTVMFKKEAVVKVGGYKDLFQNEDYYLWIRMIEANCNFANTGTILVDVRIGLDMYRRRGGLKYYKSEKFLQKYMHKKKMISIFTYTGNVFKRFVVQVLMPNKLRGWVFEKFARERIETK